MEVVPLVVEELVVLVEVLVVLVEVPLDLVNEFLLGSIVRLLEPGDELGLLAGDR